MGEKVRRALVTGGGRGIGRAICETLARDGHDVAILEKDESEVQSVIDRIESMGRRGWLGVADVRDSGQVHRVVEEIAGRWGGIDVLVNNAGITAFVDFPDLEGLTDDVWDRLYQVNVKGTFFCCRAAVAPMKKQGHGRIINLASVAGLWPQGSSIAYCCSKAAVIHLSKCLARTVGPEIQVNVIAPGFIAETRWNVGRPNLEPTIAKAAQVAPLKRVGTAEDIADAALFLATRGDFMTGDVMVVDGGRLVG